MKNTIINVFFKVLCLVFVSLMTLSVHAQRYSHLSKEEKERKSLELIENAEYMVECKMIDYEYFYGDDEKTIYTDYTLEISHWYKGRGQNIIHIIVKGGGIGDDNQFYLKDGKPKPEYGVTNVLLLKKDAGNKYSFMVQEHTALATSPQIQKHKYYLVGFHGLLFDSQEEFEVFVKRADKVKLNRKKKDVTFQKSSNGGPVINSISSLDPNSPLTVRGGLGEVVIISGNGFGTNIGEVFFRDANNPVINNTDLPNYLNGLDEIYYDTSSPSNPTGWKNDEIRVIVPSNVNKNNSDGHGAASGRVIVQTASAPGVPVMQAESEQILTIEYSLNNTGGYTSNIQSIIPMKLSLLAREHCLNGLVFTLHETFDDESPNSNLTATQSTQAINSIINALQSWENKLGITMELEKKQGGSYYFHNSTDDPHRRMIYFVDDVEGDGIMNTQITPLRDGICPQTPGGCAFPVPWTRRTDIQIEKRTDYLYNAFGDGANGQIKDFYALILHEIGHAVGLGHDVAYLKDAFGNIIIDDDTDEPIIDKKNLMSWQLKGPQNGIMYLEGNRINLDDASSSSRAIIGAQKLIAESKSHVWTVDFYDMHGIETLSNNLSDVKPTPSIVTSPSTFPNSGIQSWVKTTLKPSPFRWFYRYNWLQVVTDNSGETETTQSTTSKRTGIPVCPQNNVKHYVRIKNASCSVSSLYSLPEVFPLPGCNGTGGGRDGSLIISPNPTNNQIDITLESLEKSSVEDTHIGIYNMMGSLQKQQIISDIGLRKTTINISELPAGTYWVVWFSGSGEVIATEQVQKIN